MEMRVGSDDSIQRMHFLVCIVPSPLRSPAVIFGIIFPRLVDRILNKIAADGAAGNHF